MPLRSLLIILLGGVALHASAIASAAEMSSPVSRSPSSAAPVYPAESRVAKEEGTVVVRALIGIDGSPVMVELATSSGYDRLDQYALSAVTSWRFVPEMRGGHAVEAWVLIPITFRLMEDRQDRDKKK
jgi:protein TonB